MMFGSLVSPSCDPPSRELVTHGRGLVMSTVFQIITKLTSVLRACAIRCLVMTRIGGRHFLRKGHN